MKRTIKAFPVFYGLLFLIFLLSLATAWAYWINRSSLIALQDEFESKRIRYVEYARREPAPTAANLEQARQRFAYWHAEYDKLMEALHLTGYDRERFMGPSPEGRTEAYYEIAQMVERLRSLAQTRNVVLEEGERFGFSAYANIGPELNEVERVHFQVHVVEAAVVALLESGIDRVMDVRRSEWRSGKKQNVRRRSPGPARRFAEDWFILEESVSLAEEGNWGGQGVRLSFSGQSMALRSFLNRISQSGLPFVIRGIETDVLDERIRNELSDNREPRESSQVPIIEENRSLFIVTLEFLELVREPVSSESEVGMLEGRAL